ncbi:hypothetical protein [Phaeobacter gallaeciensis]|uniref:hypothetical protein n=1 Tax=Phaeobacter gallaeciensis TaxID=60890 RepID=UPI00237F6CF9|nr:hypothetical protein [Phaeobacter gallaeciensis]MDE4142610.1 hypothetical protein [Phaeobacter gallaeciensis]MDE4151055.1 hypothetical protein [Phaeobacter gallaeciensis]MDE4155284.1 hypothetical protein [Phaeobacter gallaeciensis]MDE4230674.1 hypothetical protein [Phaeobacter gallaeciensis]MDE4259751.1 hypothetical protein [Phaeobacter gallaeciensis]
MSVSDTNTRTVPSLFISRDFIKRIFSFGLRPLFEETSPDDARARREFIREIVFRNPDAFSSDADVQSMMAMYLDRF